MLDFKFYIPSSSNQESIVLRAPYRMVMNIRINRPEDSFDRVDSPVSRLHDPPPARGETTVDRAVIPSIFVTGSISSNDDDNNNHTHTAATATTAADAAADKLKATPYSHQR